MPDSRDLVREALDSIENIGRPLTLDEYLSYLKQIQDEIPIRIEATEYDIANQSGTQD